MNLHPLNPSNNPTPPPTPPCLMIDVAGLTLTDEDHRRLAHPLVAGVTLFGRHWQSRDQLTQLCAAIKAVRDDLLIAVDHEGGRVQRFRDGGFTHLPPMGKLTSHEQAYAAGYCMGMELRACGLDLSFAPVLDLDYGQSRVIGDRALGITPETIIPLATALISGMQAAGLSHCGKHFPGHGFAVADTHYAVAMDDRSLDTLWENDMMPFRQLVPHLQSIMTAHVIYPCLSPYPATYAHPWITGQLRQRMGFDGCVFSDDLSMEAARHFEGQTLELSQACIKTLQAGADLALVCNQSLVDEGKPLDNLLQAMMTALQQGQWQPSNSQRYRNLLAKSTIITWKDLSQHDAYHQALHLLAI